MQGFMVFFGNFLNMIKNGGNAPFFMDGEGEQTGVAVTPSMAIPVSALKGQTVAISTEYEFGKIEVEVSLTGDQTYRDQLVSLVTAYVSETLARQVESRVNMARENEPYPEIPSFVTVGFLRMRYGKTYKSPFKEKGMNRHDKIEVEEGIYFAPSKDAFIEALALLDARLSERFSELSEG